MSRKASWRGVEFQVESAGLTGGRAGPVHEFIGTDAVNAEDTGPIPKRFNLQCLVIGADADFQADQLEEALDEEGPGELIHPYRGSIECKVDGAYNMDRSTQESGMVRFSIPFVKVGDPLVPSLDLDTGFDLNVKADYVVTSITADALDVAGPDFLQQAAYAVLVGTTKLTGKLARANAKIAAATGIVTDLSSAVDDFAENLNTLLRAPATLHLALRDLANSLFTAIVPADDTLDRGDVARNAALASLALSEATRVTTNDLDPVAVTTATRQKQQDNQDLLLDVSEIVNVAEALRAMGRIPLANADQATALLDGALGLVDGILDRGTLDDGMDQAVRDLRASFLIHLRNQTVELSSMGLYTPPIDAPALAIAWDLYGDAGRDQEIIEHNLIEDPNRIHGGVPIHVEGE